MVDVAAQFGTSYTWGVSSPAFLVMYGVLVAVTGLVVLLLRRRWDQPEAIVHEPGGPEEAVLVAAMESDDRAVLVAMMRLAQDGRIRLENTALSEAGILASPPGFVPRSAAGRLRQLGPATTVYPRGSRGPRSASELELRIHTLVAAAPGSLVTTIRNQVGSGSELAALRGRLVERGLVRTPATVLRLRLVAALFLVPVAVGVVRLMSGTAHDRTTDYLALGLVATVALGVLAAIVVGRLTPRGRRVKAAARRAVPRPARETKPESDYRDLDPLLVAIDGPTSLWGRDPAMTSMLAASYTSTAYWSFLPTAGTTGGGFGWGTGGGGVASWGGASCGGGGGSNCGGGSGCGGGSCGGGGCGGGGCGGS